MWRISKEDLSVGKPRADSDEFVEVSENKDEKLMENLKFEAIFTENV